MTKATTTSEEEGEVLTTFTDDEAFILCLLFMVQLAYRRGELGRVTQHVVAFLALLDEMGGEDRNAMGKKIGALAKELGYPQRAQDLVEGRARDQLNEDINDEDLPEPHQGVRWN